MEPSVCRFYYKGNCKYGNKCKFAHTLSDMKACEFYNKGCCKYGTRCKFLHVDKRALCEKYYTGNLGTCFREHCKNLHSLSTDFRIPKLCTIIRQLNRQGDLFSGTIEIVSTDGILFYSGDIAIRYNMISRKADRLANKYYSGYTKIFAEGCILGLEVYKEYRRRFEIHKLLSMLDILPLELIKIIKVYLNTKIEPATIDFIHGN